jgi:archaellum component FlaC
MSRMLIFLFAAIAIFQAEAQAFGPAGLLKKGAESYAIDAGIRQQIESVAKLLTTASQDLETLLDSSPSTSAAEQSMSQLQGHVSKYVSLLKPALPKEHSQQLEAFSEKIDRNFSSLKGYVDSEEMGKAQNEYNKMYKNITRLKDLYNKI